MGKRFVHLYSFLALAACFIFIAANAIPGIAFAADDPSDQPVIGEAEIKTDDDELSASLDECSTQGVPPASYDVNAVPVKDEPSLMSDDSIRSGDWSYYLYSKSDDAQVYVVDHYFGSESSITIPAVLDGHQIYGVNFYGGGLPKCVTKVTIPASLHEIGANAFSYSNVAQVVIPADSQLEEIGEEAFRNTPITSFTLPNGLRRLGHNAFASTLIKSLTLNDSLEPMECVDNVWSGNDSFHITRHYNPCAAAPVGLKFNVSSNSKNYKVVNGALLSKDGKVLYAQYSDLRGGRLAAPASVQILGQWSMLLNASFGNISLPYGLTTMEEGCLESTSITELAMPDSVIHVQGEICKQCRNLNRVSISNNLEELGEMAGWECFYGCTSLNNIQLGNSLRVIGNSCFAESSITAIDFPASLEQINYGAFGDCEKLSTVSGGDNLKEIYSLAFRYTALTDFNFGNHYRFISNRAFYGCSFTPEYPSYLKELSDGYYLLDQLKVMGDKQYSAAYEVLDLVNQERSKNGLNPLQMDKDLLDAAMLRAFETSVAFSHTRLTGNDCFTASNKMFGENIAYGNATASGVMSSWMNSPGHRSNILGSNYKSVGIGCVKVSGVCFWVQCFGRDEADACDQPSDESLVPEVLDYTKSGLDDLQCLFRLVKVSPDGASHSWSSDNNLFVGNSQRYALAVRSSSYVWNFLLDDSASWAVDSSGNVVLDSDSPTITGKTAGGYSLTATLAKRTGPITVSINGEVKKQTIKVGVPKVSDLTYNGKKQTPTVNADGFKVVKNQGGTSAGNYSIEVALSDPDYSTWDDGIKGNKTIGYKILPADISMPQLSPISPCPLENGKAEPKIILTFNGAALVEGSDYSVSYANNTLPGTGVINITGMGNFRGSASAKFQVLPALGLTRLAGSTRYETMDRLVDFGNFATGGSAIIASGSNFPDALSAASLAGCTNAPILLTDPTSLSPETRARIQSLRPSILYVIGGEAAVSSGVEGELGNLLGGACRIIRIAGETRYDTSLSLALCGEGQTDTLIVATGSNYADALAISPYAYASCSPVLLCDPYLGFSGEALAIIGAGGYSKALIVGGNAVVPESVEEQLRTIGVSDITRLAGATRYETSSAIADFELSSGTGFDMDNAMFATGINFPDALAAGPVAGSKLAPLLLVDPGASAVCSYLCQYGGEVSRSTLVGGVNAISDNDARLIARVLRIDLLN